jgi:hypothetical protein
MLGQPPQVYFTHLEQLAESTALRGLTVVEVVVSTKFISLAVKEEARYQSLLV